MFVVTVKDPNPQDILYVRWVSDYPRYTQASALLRSEEVSLDIVDGEPLGSVKFSTAAPAKPDGTPGAACLNFAPGQEHKLVLIISDRPFTPPDVAPNPEYRFNAVSMGGSEPIMARWDLTCP